VPKKGSGYVSVTIPEETDRDIEKIKRTGHGYRSKADVVEDAIRRLLLTLKKTEGS
jgi:Arc/MetJ-type ribon-helix-helix transcriptional regulator